MAPYEAFLRSAKERIGFTGWLAGLAAALSLVGGVSAAPFQNGSFEDSIPSCTELRSAGQPLGAGWVVSRGSVYWYNASSLGACPTWHAADGAGSLHLVGAGTIGGVSQNFDTQPGAIYRLAFAIAGNTAASPPSAKPYDVYVDGVKLVGGTFDVTGRTATDMGWQVVTHYFVATNATTNLEFVSDVTPYTSAGAALDDVRVTMVSTPAGEFQNGSFELGPPQAQCAQTLPVGSTALLGWTVAAGEVRRVGGCGWQQGSGDYSVELGSPNSTVGAIEQTFATVPTNVYRVTFKLAGNPAVTGSPAIKPLTISIDGVGGTSQSFNTTGRTTDAMGWIPIAWSFIASSTSTTLRFTGDLGVGSTAGASVVVDTIQVLGDGLLRNPSFDLGAPATCDPAGHLNDIPAGSTAIPGWDVSVGSVDWVGPCVFTSNYTNSYMLDLIGSGKVGGIKQIFATVPGRRYGVFTALAGNPTGDPVKPIRITVDGVTSPNTFNFNTAGRTPANMGWLGWVIYFTPPDSTATVEAISDMTAAASSGAGVVMDNLTVWPVPPPIELTNVTATTVSGRIDDPRYWGYGGAGSPGAAVRLSRQIPCGGGGSIPGTFEAIPLETDATGNFTVTPSAAVMAPGSFLWVQLFDRLNSTSWTCVYLGADNEVWPRALSIDGSLASTQDYLDTPGKARWYKFSVLPGQQVKVSLNGLPADYDLAVFKDIRSTFSRLLIPETTTDLTKLSAEYAPSMFSPSMFSPSVFSPAVFSPDAYAPSMFSPSMFSPSMFSPSMFSPSVVSPSMFSPSMFSPSMFSPSMFSPSMFSPSMFSPSMFSPSMFSPTEISQAFSSAQTRSLLGVSATSGRGNEVIAVNTWNEVGEFYVRVWGRGGASSIAAPFTLSVEKGPSTCTGVTDLAISSRAPQPAAGVRTVFVTDSSHVDLDEPLLSGGTLRQRVTTLLARSEIGGVLLDVGNDARVQALKAQAVANAACPFSMNLVAQEIKGMIDAYRANNPLRYVVLAGNDGVIPFFRYPDESLLGQESGYSPPVASTSTSEASLRRDFVLGQDAYGASRFVAVRTTDLPVPDLAVGRLVETPAEMAGLIDAYVAADGRVVPQTSLVTGYDFLADVAAAVKDDLEAGTARAASTLITPNTISPQDPAAWTASDLKQALLTQRHDLIFLAGHFSANSALAADFATSLVTLDIAASTVDLTNALVFSAGCHSGYNVVDGHAIEGLTLKLDWAQVMAQKRATLVAGTGYQYGDTDFIEYSERLYQGFARQLRYGSGAIAVGEALARAKVDYLISTPDLRGLHQKAVLQATVFGLPMLGIDLPAGRIPQPAVGPGVTPSAASSGPAALLGLKTETIRVAPLLTPQTLALQNVSGGPSVTARWLSGPDGVVSNPAVPALPLAKVNVTSSDASVVLRGVGFRGGRYTDLAGIVPLTGAATADLRGVHVPFGSPTFFPMRLATANYFGALAGSGGTMLLVTPAQYRADDVLAGTSVERRFDHLDFKLYYSGIALSPDDRSVALSDAPTIVSVDARTDFAGGPVNFLARVVGDPAATIHEVWLTFAPAGVAASGANWSSIDLQQCVADDAGRLPAGCSGETDSSLWTAQLATPTDIQYIVQAASGTGLVALDDNLGHFHRVNGSTPPATTTGNFTLSPPTAANFGETPSVSLAFKAGAAPLANQLVIVSIGGNASVGMTDASGNVTVGVPVVTIPGSYELKAYFAGDATHAPTVVSTPFVVGKAPTAIGTIANGVTLTANLGGKIQPLIQETVIFEVSGSNGPSTVHAATDYLGRALLPPPGLPPGTYTVNNARFAGNATYQAASVAMSATFTLAKATQSINFAPLPTVPIGAPDFLVGATTSSGLPVSFSVAGDCTLIGLSTVHVTVAGSCTVTASQPGNAYYDAATPVSRSFVIGAGALSVSAVVTPASFTYGDDSPGGITVSYQYALIGDSVCMPSPLPTAFTGPASPLSAGSHVIAPPPLTLPPGCVATYNSATLNVAKAPAAFSGIAPVITLPADQAFTVAGRLNRPDLPTVYPRGSDVSSFEVILHRSATQSQSLTPGAPAAPNGNFAVGGPGLPVGSYELEFLYDGGPNFTGASDLLSTLRVEGFASTAVQMTEARSDHTATLLNDGRVLVVGGKDARGAAGATTEVYCPAGLSLPPHQGRAKAMCPAGLGAFGAMPRLQGKSAGHTATLMPGGTVLIVGGGNASTELFDPSTNTFTQVGGAGGSRAYHTATLLPSGLVLLVGGADPFGTTLATTQLYDPRTSVYRPGPTLLWPRERHSATLIGAGANAKVIIAGGRQKGANGYSVLANVEIYDVSRGTLAAAAPMAGVRYAHQAEALADGRVLVTGGSSGTTATPSGALASAELYVDGGWNPVLPPMHDARREHSLTHLLDGRLLAIGGSGSNGAQSSSETFGADGADLFTVGPPLTIPRYGHAATRLGDGRRVLVTGGVDATGNALRSAEIFTTPP